MKSAPATDDLSALVLATLGVEQETSITRMLQAIAERFDAFGCGLWEIAPNADSDARPPQGFLLTVGAWWESGRFFALDDVPLHNSPTATAAVEQRSIRTDDIQRDGGAKKDHRFWRENKVRAMCVVAVRFLDDSLGSLNIYRQEGQPPFTESEEERLEAMARLVPGLYRAVREKIGLHLVSDVEKLLRETESATGAGPRQRRVRLKPRDVQTLLKKVCVRVAQAFDCVETSIFLEEETAAGAKAYKCAATTNVKCVARKTYHPDKDGGRLTGWVLANWSPIWVPDLAKPQQYAEFLAEHFTGLNRQVGPEDTLDARRLLKIPKSQDLPPLSFMAVPVFGGQDWFGGTDLRGVMRCHMARSGPFYFSEREVELLGVVAAQVGQWWARWRAGAEMAQENASWQAMVDRLGELNKFVRQQLGSPKPDEGAILREALRLTSAVIPGAVLNGIRMYDADSNELYFAEFSAEAEGELKKLKRQKDALRRFKVETKAKAAGVRVFLTGKPYDMRNTAKDRRYAPIFPGVTKMIIVPVGVAEERYGVLDLRWTNKPVPPYAKQAATVLGQQIGIYHQLTLLIAEQRDAAMKAEKLKLEEASAHEDFAHQVKSPIMQAKMRAENALEVCEDPEERRRWVVVRGLIRRASRVSMSMRLLAELSHNRLIAPKKVVVDRDVLLRKLIELADDTQLNVSEKGIVFHVLRDTFNNSIFRHFAADFDLLEQMVANLLDNAAKYSRSRSVVRIFGGISQGGRPYISVTNRGLAFGPGETEKCKQRGYRSPNAKLIATEGQGIGLWVVDQLMRAHGGELLIESPNSQGENEVRLAFQKMNI